MIFPIFFYVNDHAFREVLPKSHDEAWTASWETRAAYVCRSVMNVPDNVRTGYTLTEIRRIHDMNKKDMTNVLGISERSYCTLENGLSRPDIKILQIVYDMYGFNVQYFLTRNPLDCEAVNNIYRCFDEPLRDFIMRRIRDDYDEIIIMKGRTYGRDI